MSRTKTATPQARKRSATRAERSDETSFLNQVLDQAAAVLASNPTDARRVRYVRALPHIMTEWFGQPRYLGSDDRPLHLKLRGRGPTVSELVASVLPGEDPSDVAEALIRGKAVERRGDRYIAVNRQVTFSEDLDLARAHTIGILSGQISTIQHNVTSANPKDRALEREVFNLSIPVRLLPRVHGEIRSHGVALLSRLDSLLHENQVRPGSEPTVGVGVSISAYQDRWLTKADELGPSKTSTIPPVSTDHSPSSVADGSVVEAIQRFVRICRMFGVSQDKFIACVRQEYFSHAESPPRPRIDASKEIPQAPEVMSTWHDNPRYTRNGMPRALRKRGRSPSFETLVREVDANLDVDHVLRYLIRTGTVQRRGTRYAAIRDTVIVHGVEGPAVEWALRGLAQMLAVAEHNLTVKDVREGLFERRAENPYIPVSKLSDVKKFVEDEGMSFLRRGNTLLRELQLQRRPGEPTVEAGFGVYRLQTENRSRSSSADPSQNRRSGNGARRAPRPPRRAR